MTTHIYYATPVSSNPQPPFPKGSIDHQPLRAYLINAGEHVCTVEHMGELGEIREEAWVASIVYTSTPGRAKKRFIAHHRSFASYTQYTFEWTDKMSIRLLATEGRIQWSEGVQDVYSGDWSDNGNVTNYGGYILGQMLRPEDLNAWFAARLHGGIIASTSAANEGGES